MGTVDHVVDVLDAANAHRRCGAQLLDGDVAEPDAEDLFLVAQSRHLDELILERHDLFAAGEQPRGEVHLPQVDDIDPVSAQGEEIRFHCSTQLERLLRHFQRDRCGRDRLRSHFCGNEDIVATVSEARAKHLVGLPVAVELRGIEVCDPEVECYVKELDGLGLCFRAAGMTGDLARTVAHAGYRSASQRERSAGERTSRHECLAHRETPFMTSSTFVSGNQACAAALFPSVRDEYDRSDGAIDEAMMDWLSVVRMADQEAVRWALAALPDGHADKPVGVRLVLDVRTRLGPVTLKPL